MEIEAWEKEKDALTKGRRATSFVNYVQP